MTGPDIAIIGRRLVVMRQLLDHLKGLGDIAADQLESDLGLRLQVSMALAQLVTLATEVNSHVVRHLTGNTPADLRSSFDDMARVGWLQPAQAAALRDSAGMRNVLMHEYVRVDLRLVADAVPTAVTRYGEYVRAVASRLPTD